MLCIALASGYCGWIIHANVGSEEYIIESETETVDITTQEESFVQETNKASMPTEEEVFIKFTEEYWQNITMSEIEQIAEELSLLISYDLALTHEVDVDIIYDTEITWIGCYVQRDLIQINLFRLYKHCNFYNKEPYKYIVNVTAHEYRHAYQRARVEKGYTTKLEENYKNYIQPSEGGYEAYFMGIFQID